MQYFFLTSFIAGLLAGVYAMFRGVERRRRGPAAARGPIGKEPEAQAIVSLPMAAAFATVFGATGYLLGRATTLGPLSRVGIAAAVGAAGAAGALALVAAWAVPSAREDVVDERFLLMGHVARVTSPIGAGAAGTIAFEHDGTPHAIMARSMDGAPLEAGTEVVIERVEGDVAYVEPWARVEERL
jgi:membrane protein implicated in regulation of membrane protease activity